MEKLLKTHNRFQYQTNDSIKQKISPNRLVSFNTSTKIVSKDYLTPEISKGNIAELIK